MAASAKMSFNYFQNGKYGTLPQNPQKDMEVTQDMHLKMSKKIAQLTKVIYALNTKNDEHDSVLQSLRETHEEEVQQILSETKQKIAHYKAKVNEDTEYRRKIESLEACIADHERHRREALEQFDNFKRQAEDREIRLKTEHSQAMLALSQDVLSSKKNFETQLEKFEDWRRTIDLEKENAVTEYKLAHEEELKELRSFQRSQNNDWLNEVTKVEEKYKAELEQLKEKCEGLNNEKEKVVEDYELKLNKAQAFFEKELEALQNAKSSLEERSSDVLREEQERMRRDFMLQESELRKQISGLVDQLTDTEAKRDTFHKELEQLKSSLQDKNTNFHSLTKQLQDAKEDASRALTQLKEVESELVASKQMCSEQAAEMLKKSSIIGNLEATKLQHESTIKDLQKEANKLKDRLSWLESERKSLENKQQTLTEQQQSQLTSLEKALEDLSIEKQTLKERYEREIEGLRDKASRKESDMAAEHEAKIKGLCKSHQEEMDHEKQTSDETLQTKTKELQSKFDDETARLTADKEAVLSEFERVRADLFGKLSTAQEEIQRLEKLVKDSEQGLGSASGHINSLKDATTRLKSELDNTREELRLSKLNATSLQNELDKLKQVHESKMRDAKVELRTHLDQLSLDLESKWTETLRLECSKLRQELSQQNEDEKRAALQQLAKLKDAEIAAARSGWESKVNELLRQISVLKENIDARESTSAKEVERVQREAEDECRKLKQELANVGNEYAHKIKFLEETHEDKMRRITEQKDQELEEQQRRLTDKHMEDMQTQMAAHRVSVDSMKDEADKHMQSELDKLAGEHKNILDEMKNEMLNRHAMNVENQNKAHEQQLHAARLELERAVEISKQRDKDHNMKVEELQEEISHRERHIRNLQTEIDNLQGSIDHLMKEIESKGKEILKCRSDANQQVKKTEEHLSRRHKSDMDNIRADHVREAQQMVTEFNEAQELLKDKISSLQILLEEAEEKYHNRDSRPEDLELIEQLRDAVSEREMRMKQLIDEKRFYQLELVNRETNFNKVFNATPNVGVLNPLQAPKRKKGSGVPSKNVSSPSLNYGGQRLEPLPGSPLHDEKLNPSRPLPQPAFTKKFMR